MDRINRIIQCMKQIDPFVPEEELLVLYGQYKKVLISLTDEEIIKLLSYVNSKSVAALCAISDRISGLNPSKPRFEYGIIIHYGLYSYYGYDDVKSAKRRKTQNGSEWYYGRLIDDNNFRPISGRELTKQYHAEHYKDMDYFDNLDKITTDENKIKEWVSVAKNYGASHIIITSKHHDGVCLWNTKTTQRKSSMDICKVFSDECKRQNIKFGFYYSWFEFDKPFTTKYFDDYCIPQLKELMKYKPDYMWFDGDWKITQKSIMKTIGELVKEMIKNNIIVNDRIGKLNRDEASYRVFSDRYIPEQKIDGAWEHINTVGYSWGYNKQQTKSDYKTKEEILALYNKVKSLDGSFLINFGPDQNADIIKYELDAIKLLKN